MAATPTDAWRMFISDNITNEIIKCTNQEGRRVASERGKEWKALDEVELDAFIGLTLLAGGEKSWDVDLRELFLDPLQNPMYKATMGVKRFEDIRRFLWFDDKRTRALRLETDHMAAFRYIWECFLVNCRGRFIPSDCVTIDAQLVRFRGRCKFLQYMPSKPAKYGIKVFWMCDARVPYAIDGTVYTGKQPGEKAQKNLGEKVVQQLSSVIRQTGRNITMDNFFTSVPLAQSLLEKNLTLVGTLRQNKADIPPLMKPSDSRERYSSVFGFCGDMSMVSYVPKKNKAVVLLSTMHNDTAVDDNMKKKPEIIQYYNKTKGGVDLMDQMVHTYTSMRRTRRWPMVLWQNMVDVGALNAFTIFTSHHSDYMGGVPNARRLFIKELAKELIMPYMRRRMETSLHLQRHVTQAMEICGIQRWGIQPQEPPSLLQRKRKRCCLCPSARDRKVSHSCSKCARPVCKDHKLTLVICEKCNN